MKKTLLTIIAVFLLTQSYYAIAQDTKPNYKREGKTFVQTENELMKGDKITTYTWRDKEGKDYPIILHTYTKGEKAGRTTAYVWRVSKKSGKEYRYYLPDGEKIAEEIIKESEI